MAPEAAAELSPDVRMIRGASVIVEAGEIVEAGIEVPLVQHRPATNRSFFGTFRYHWRAGRGQLAASTAGYEL